MSDYIVFDLEWNQNPGRHSAGDVLPFEIIEIGAVKLSDRLQPIAQFDRLIRPQVYHRMHSKIAEVTHLTMNELNRSGIDFPRAVAEFLDWCGDDYVFCTWGSMDLTELERNMVYHGIRIPFPRPLLYYDLQKIYGLIKGDNSRESLDTAVQALSISTDRPFHRAADDAWYTGSVMRAMGFNQKKEYLSVDYYRLPREEENPFAFHFPDYDKIVTHPWDSRDEALADRDLTRLICPICHRSLRKKIRWFTSTQKYYYCLGVCPEHGFVKSKIRIKKADDGRCFAVRTTKLTNQAGADTIQARKEAVRQKRAERNKRAKAAENAGKATIRSLLKFKRKRNS